MSQIPSVVGGVGVALVGSSIALYSQECPIVSSLCGVAGAALLYVGFLPASLNRSSPGVDLSKQTKFIEGSEKFVTEKDEDGKEISVRYGQKGTLGIKLKRDACKDPMGTVYAGSEDVRTVYDMIFGTSEFDTRDALGRCAVHHTFKDKLLPDGKPNPKPAVVETPGEWEFLTYADVKKQARAFGTGLRKQYNIGQKEKIAIWSGNSIEWMLTDLSCAAFNWASVSVYDTLGPNAASYIVADSGAQVVVCETKTFMSVPALLEDEIYAKNAGADLKVVVYVGKGDSATKAKIEEKGIKVVSFNDIVEANIKDLEADTPGTKDDICTLMYTSGTTGMPKGVILKNFNIVATVAMIDLTPSFSLTSSDVHLSYLPLAHIFERQVSYGLLKSGAKIYFSSQGTKALLPDLSVVRPTVFAGVPKVYENVRDAVARKMTGFKKTLFQAALKAKTADIETGCGYSKLWDILVFNKTKAALGGRCRIMVTGGAPISKDTLQFVLCALGPVVQGYGATETSAASSLTMSFDLTLGHVGPAIGSSVLRLVDVPDMNYFTGTQSDYKDGKAKAAFDAGKNKSGGEVWIGGPGVSVGYWDPSKHGLKEGVPSNGMAKKTEEEFFTEDDWSWFKTGDIGTWTNSGCLKIVDRRKNMFKTSLGEYIPVEEVEKTYQDSCDMADFVFLPKETKVSYICLCVVVSDSIGTVRKWAKANEVDGDDKAIVSSPKFKQHLFDQFAAAAKEKKLQGFMKILKLHNIHVEFQPLGYQENWVAGVVCANGQTEQLLTATFKARRTQLDQYFAPHFATMYPDRPADHILP